MKQTANKIILIVICCAFLIVGSLVGISLVNSRAIYENEAEKSLGYLCDKHANEFNALFSDSELMVNNIAAAVEMEYTVAEYKNDRHLFENKKQLTNKLLNQIVGNSKHPIGLYITYAPENSGGKDEIWYVKDRSGKVKFIDSIAISDSWLQKQDSTEYYYKAISEGALWLDSAYDPGMDGETVSYSRSLRDKNGDLIGVVGVDILLDNIINSINTINKEINGYSAFIEHGSNVIAGKNLSKYKHSANYIYTEAKIGEKWLIAMSQPIDVAIDPILETEFSVVLLGILIILTAICLVIYFSRKHVRPIIEEVEFKDAILINKARQIKMGEMIGNLAHQLKQPLNGMKMSLSNVLEDYRNAALDENDFEDYIYRMTLMIDNLAETANDFIAFMKPERTMEQFSMKLEIERMLRLMDERVRLNSVKIDVKGSEEMLIGYRNEFGQCIFNLIDNALYILKDEPKWNRHIIINVDTDETIVESKNGTSMSNSDVAYTAAAKPIECSKTHIVKVFNNGPHIKEEHKDKIFDLYFSTKDDKEGSGIGLYLIRQILKTHFNGDISVANVDGGVCFTIQIPERTDK